mmetsp:Transcript_72699/g.201594  ORF Transcript_72699/g.201594 Transcript_72699/m.201594 type:complete len:230 (-) Transcript_72699:409-1098(-)
MHPFTCQLAGKEKSRTLPQPPQKLQNSFCRRGRTAKMERLRRHPHNNHASRHTRLILSTASPNPCTRDVLSSSGGAFATCWRRVVLDSPITGALRQLLVQEPADAIGPAETKHTNTCGLRVRAPHSAGTFGRRPCWHVVEIQAEQMDRRDDDLHGAWRGELRDLVGPLPVHVRGGLNSTCDHGWQNESGADDQTITEQKGTVGCQWHRTLYRLRGIRRLGKHLRESNIL